MLTSLREWAELEAHFAQIQDQKMSDLFAQDPQRFERFSLALGPLLLDYSKNRINQETLTKLCALARARDLPQKIEALYQGERVNSTEARPALHMALRDHANFAVGPKVAETLARMRVLVASIHQGHRLGATGKPFTEVVNIGIGGSHLGPLMASYALQHHSVSSIRLHFIADVDSLALDAVLAKLDPERTLLVISSKSFTTLETLANARNCARWLQQRLGKALDELQTHFVAVTACEEAARRFGVRSQDIFPIWDWVGGRYSLWSAIGLPLALQIGMDNFDNFLDGARLTDQHFRSTPLEQNLPVIMALLSLWYINFFKAPTQALIPYCANLKYLRAYLQQLDMESNGKRRTHAGHEVAYATGPIIWGELGIHGQHAFHQLLHQGTHLVPVDFLVVGEDLQKADSLCTSNQDLLVANAFAQARALMQGRDANECSQNSLLERHQEIPGNKPSNLLFLSELTPYSLGLLIAVYEHKVFVQSAIWDVNPFDQWGVELGKNLLPEVLAAMRQGQPCKDHDSSTANLIRHYRACQEGS